MSQTDSPETTAEQTASQPPLRAVLRGGSRIQGRLSPRLEMTISPETEKTLDDLAEMIRGTRADVLVKAIALLKVAVEAQKQGKRIAIVEQVQPEQTEIVGLLPE